jgi:hypothetical protein
VRAQATQRAQRSFAGQWTPSKRPTKAKQAVRKGRIPWVPGAVQERAPLTPAYIEHLASRLAEAACLDLNLARKHVQAVAIRPLPPRPTRQSD